MSYDIKFVAPARAQQLHAPPDDNIDVVRHRCCRTLHGRRSGIEHAYALGPGHRSPQAPVTRLPRTTSSMSYDIEFVAPARVQQLHAPPDDNIDVVRHRCCRAVRPPHPSTDWRPGSFPTDRRSVPTWSARTADR